MHGLCRSVIFFSSFIISFRHVRGGGRACDLQILILVIGQMDCCPASFVRLISHFLQTGKMRGNQMTWYLLSLLVILMKTPQVLQNS